MTARSRCAVLVPARDEAEALPALAEALRAPLGSELLVVDNGSRDGTAAVARELGATVVSEPRPGYGRACLRGLRELAGRPSPPEFVVFLDADDPAAAARIERLLGPLVGGRADLVLGRRRSGPDPGVPFHAAWGNAAVAWLLRGLFAVPSRDLGPFRAGRLSGLLEMGLDEPAYGWNVQMQLRALRVGWRVEEVDVPFRRRRAGRSKISGSLTGSARAAAGLLRGLFRELFRPVTLGSRRGTAGP